MQCDVIPRIAQPDIWPKVVASGDLTALGDKARCYYFGTALTIACHPFEAICTPMHKSTNATTRKIPWMVVGAIFCVILEAYT